MSPGVCTGASGACTPGHALVSWDGSVSDGPAEIANASAYPLLRLAVQASRSLHEPTEHAELAASPSDASPWAQGAGVRNPLSGIGNQRYLKYTGIRAYAQTMFKVSLLLSYPRKFSYPKSLSPGHPSDTYDARQLVPPVA